MAAALRGEKFRAPRLGYKAPEKLGKKLRPWFVTRRSPVAAGENPTAIKYTVAALQLNWLRYGFGKRPEWFNAALAAGKTPEDLLAKG